MDFLADSPVHEAEKIKIGVLKEKSRGFILLIFYSKT